MEDTAKVSQQNDMNKVVTAIENMGLTSVNVGDYLIILNKNIDVTVDDEPYISFILFYHTTSGRFFKRIWNKTVATGTTSDIATLVKVCSAYFNRGKPCLSFITDGQNEMPENIPSACFTFTTKNHGGKNKMCSECKKTRDTITNGMREEQAIKIEDLEDINGYGQCDQPPCEEVFDDALEKDEEVAKVSDKPLLDIGSNLPEKRKIDMDKKGGIKKDLKEQLRPPDRPNMIYKELIAEALEDGTTMYVEEITKSISQKHTSLNVSDASIRRCLSDNPFFERVNQVEGGMRGLWRLSTSNEASDQCDYCDKSFPEGKRGEKYKWHMRAWHGRNNFHCSSCDFKANFASDVFAHIEEVRHKERQVDCPMCNESFDKDEKMASHYRGCFLKKQTEKQKRVNLCNNPCPTCGKVIKNKKTYKIHLMMHLRKQGEQDSVVVPYSNGEKKNLYFYCDKCDKKYTERYALRKHVQTEHEGVGLKCDMCSLTLSTVYHLKKHKTLEHSTDMRLACKFCGKRCVSEYFVKLHERRHQEPQFQCSICAKRLKSEKNLIAHERLHRGEKPFKCSTCNDGFISAGSLRQHERGVHKISGPQGGKTGWSKANKVLTAIDNESI